MMKLLNIISKNFRILLNSKFSSLIFILGPLILMILVGSVLSNTSIKNVDAGVYIGPGVSDFSGGFISGLEGYSFHVVTESSLSDCKNAVLSGKTDVCIDMEQSNFNSLGGQYPAGYNLNLYVDFSQERVVWSIIATIQRVAGEESQAITNQRVNTLKAEASTLIKQLNDGESRINSVMYDLNYAESTLQTINNNQQTTEISVNQSISQLSSVLSVLNIVESSGQVPFPYNSSLQNSIYTLQSTHDNLVSLSQNFQNVDIPSLINQISNAKTTLNNISDSLSLMQNNLQGIQNSDLNKITNPVSVSYFSARDSEGGSPNTDLQSFDYIFPSFLMFFILLSSLIYSTIDIMRERTSNAYIRNLASKANGFDFVFSSFFTSVCVVFIQIVAILVLASFFVHLSLFVRPISLFFFLLIAVSFFCLLGLAVGMIFNSYESAIVGSISLSLLFFMFSSIIAPAETLPKTLSTIVSYSPFALLESKARFLMIFNSSLSFSMSQSIILASLVVFIGLITILLFKRSKEKEI